MSNPIYLDHNATTPLSELVKAELARLLQLDLGNPSRGTEASRGGNL
jgi:cysteine sulfinate desulfinase/cysteine desulfurase-like protein